AAGPPRASPARGAGPVPRSLAAGLAGRGGAGRRPQNLEPLQNAVSLAGTASGRTSPPPRDPAPAGPQPRQPRPGPSALPGPPEHWGAAPRVPAAPQRLEKRSVSGLQGWGREGEASRRTCSPFRLQCRRAGCQVESRPRALRGSRFSWSGISLNQTHFARVRILVTLFDHLLFLHSKEFQTDLQCFLSCISERDAISLILFQEIGSR
ncbi:PREDICTED: formin-like protein 18, partial [Chinchilla lanigera]|uniref:formin-like protein 18 n=1 Tax=Chinchilla lanigera TaxID=34839 RepID=UPI000697C4E9